MSSRRSRKESKTVRTTSKRQRSAVWQYVAMVAIVLAVAGGVYRSISAMPVRPTENSTTVSQTGQAQATTNTTPSMRWTNDIPVLAYAGSDKGWQPMRIGQVAKGQEFQFKGHLYYIDQNNGVWEVGIDVTKLAEADQGFEPYQWRYPEMEDMVRFVDQNNRHLRHDRMGTFKAGDRFLFQGILYEGFADPNGPAGLAYRATNLVQNRDGNIITVEEYALAAGDSLDKVYDRNASLNNDTTGVLVSTGSPNVAGQSSQLASTASSNGLGGLPTDFGFTGQRWEQSIGLYDYGARFYDPALGRFISPDPIVPNPQNPQSWNRYSYALNNPVKYTDPTGHMACLEDDFCFRRANGTDLVVRGGSYFINPVEIGLANYYLSGGDTVHLNAVPAYNPLPLTYSKAGVEVALGYRENRPGMPDIASGVGAAVIVGKDDDILPAESVPAGERLGYTQTARDAATGAAGINPYEVRFSQSSINYSFRDGGNIDDLAEGLRSGRIRPEDVPPIRLVERNGKLYTLDNRRLEAFRRAGVNVPYRMATSEEIAAEGWKFTTRNDGISIRVRGR